MELKKEHEQTSFNLENQSLRDKRFRLFIEIVKSFEDWELVEWT